MVDRPERDAAAVRYLLGVASEQEKTALEETLFKDPAALDEISAVEDELIDEYLSGELAGDERSSFDSAYFATPERRERVAFARTLRQRLSEARVQPLAAPSARAFPMFPVLLAAAAVLFAILAAVFGMESLRARRQARELLAERAAATQREKDLSRRVGEVQAETERLKQEVASERSEGERLARELETFQTSQVKTSSLVLIAGLVRGGGSLPTVHIAADTENLRLNAPLPQVSYRSYRAAVQTPEGRSIWKGTARSPEVGSHSVVVNLPARALAPGDYILSVLGVTAAGREESAADFSFRVKTP